MIKLQQRSDFSGDSIYVGIDVHLKSWNVSIFYDQQYLRSFQQPPEVSKLVGTLRKDYPNATYYCGYEAGFSGFWIQRELTKAGVNCVIVNAADIPQTDKERKTKTDRIDSKRIGRGLQAGYLRPIYVPDPEIESHRRLVRYRRQLLEDLRRSKARVKHFLHLQGIRLPEEFQNGYWSKRFLSWLRGLEHDQPSKGIVLKRMLDLLERLKQDLASLDKDINKIIKSSQYSSCASLLQSIPGIGSILTACFLFEVGDIKRFPTFGQFNSYIGLCPGEYSSGEEERKGRIISRHHAALRSLLIEGSWIAVRKDPALAQVFRELKKRMTAKRAIIRIARKLLSRLYHVWIKNETYETGIVK